MTTQTDIDYALMAGAAYISTRDPVNQLPTPNGWVGTNYDNPTDGGGFEAITFIRSGTTLATSNEIVISFAGTDPADVGGDIAADLSLAAGTGLAQLLQAVDYYLQLKKQVEAVNPNATITLTYDLHRRAA